jgi:integrase/recombinase XerC
VTAINVPAPNPRHLVAGGLSPAAAKAINLDPREIVQRWLSGLAAGSRVIYARALRNFTAWALPAATDSEEGLRLLCSAGAAGSFGLLVGWRDSQQGLAPNTIASNISAITSLLRVARRCGLIDFVVDGVAPVRERVQDRSGPALGDVQRMVATIDDAAVGGLPRAVRDAAIVRLLFCCAMRRNEVCTLQLADVNLDHPDGPQVRALRKGHRQRKPVLISTNTAAAIARWVEVRGQEPGPLFYRLDRDVAAQDRRPLQGQALAGVVGAWARAAGIRVRVRCHGLRHSAASEAARRGSLAELQALGSWRSLSSAGAYIDERQDVRRRALAIVDL